MAKKNNNRDSNGKLHGKIITLDQFGDVWVETNYSHGLMNGYWKTYLIGGKLNWVAFLENDYYEGESINFYY